MNATQYYQDVFHAPTILIVFSV